MMYEISGVDEAMAREVVAERLGCSAVLADDEQSAQGYLRVGEHVHSVRRGLCGP